MVIALIVAGTIAAVSLLAGAVSGLVAWALYRRLRDEADGRPYR